jgi:hypothetical protein
VYYGSLNRVTLYLENYTPSPPTGAVLTVSVQTVIGGLPSGKQIGSGTIPLSAIPPLGSPGWVEVNITGAIVIPSTQYALVLQTSNAVSHVTWWYAYRSYYWGATAFNDGTDWRIDENYDFTFQTYIIPDVQDQSFTNLSSLATYTGSTLGQIFTAGVSGVLDRVSVSLITSVRLKVE